MVVTIVAILINTVILEEVVELLDNNIAIAKVQLKLNMGWKLAMTASALVRRLSLRSLSEAELTLNFSYFQSLLGTFLHWIIALVLMISTDRDHENLTNAEIDWKNELEKRELVTIRTAIGNICK